MLTTGEMARPELLCNEVPMGPTSWSKSGVKKPLWLFSILVGTAFLAIFYFGNRHIQSTDCRYVIPSALSLLNDGNLDVDEFFDKPNISYKPSDYQLEVIHKRHYNRYPIGQVLLAVPFVFLANKVVGLDFQSDLSWYLHLELIIGCISAAAACVVICLMACLRLGIWHSLLLTIIFGLGTSVWSTASCGFWQHGPSIFLLTLVLYIVVLAEKHPHIIQYVGIPVALSYLMRPTNALSVTIFTLYVWWKYRQYFLRYLLLSSLVAIPFLIFNEFMYHRLLSPYYEPGSLGIPRHIPQAVVGLLISPSRGLFVFSPVLLFSLYGMALSLRPERYKTLDGFILLIPIGHLAATALSNPMWWGGHSFGPRMMVDIIPFLAYFLIPVLDQSSNWKGSKAVFMWTLMGLSLAFSIFVHFTGAASPLAWSWNIYPTNIDQDSARLWDWNDSQALRTLFIWLDK
jgi:hypothetical protein